MAILNATDLSDLRRDVCKGITVDFVKSQINAALQAIEDRIENSRAVLSADIDTATAPYVLSASMKKKLVAHYFRQKFTREGV